MTTVHRPVLHVCITCKANQPCEDGEQRPGHKVYEAIERLIETDDAGARIELRPVSCLAACERGCAATIFMPGKFGYLLGGLTPDLAADVLAYAGAYAASVTGVVLPSRRAASLRHAILGRFPPQDTQTPDQQPKAAP